LVLCTSIAVYAPIVYFKQNTIDISAIYPPVVGLHKYLGPTLGVIESTFIINVKTVTNNIVVLHTQVLVSPYNGTPVLNNCLTMHSSSILLIGPCYFITHIVAPNGNVTIITFYNNTIPEAQVTYGVYNTSISQPTVIEYICGQHPMVYVNSTQIPQSAGNCVVVQTVTATYYPYSGGRYG
jgi:hypothetical protein